MALGSIFGGCWLQVGRQVGAKLAPRSEKRAYQDNVKKSFEISSSSNLQNEEKPILNGTFELTSDDIRLVSDEY